ncbi:MAG TPA: sugar phosphate isomerase/epimerase family protein [Solirubrobacteraceae bacterium]|nr:sugar phosphate isomerase/epimerase family protein [Solirubrobacteraceae bacterium]
MILACQESLLPGASLLDKWQFARDAGFDGIELQGGKDFGERLDEVRAAAEAGAVFPSVCVATGPFIGAFDDGDRRWAIGHVKQLLSTVAAVGGRGVVTPAAYGMFSRFLPPYTPPRDAAGDREVLLDSLRELGEHAGDVGAELYLEPLNRYEDHMLNRVEQAVELCEAVGHPALKVMGDTYHMNIEEADPVAALRAAGSRLRHVHLSDSNRLEPGAGHVDFDATLVALRAGGFDGILAFEGRLSGPADEVLPLSAGRMNAIWRSA